MLLLVYSGDHNHMHIFISLETSVLDSDLEITRGGGGSVQKKFSVWSKNGGAAPPGPSPGPGSATKPSCLIGNDLRLTQFHSRGDKIKFSVVKFDIR